MLLAARRTGLRSLCVSVAGLIYLVLPGVAAGEETAAKPAPVPAPNLLTAAEKTVRETYKDQYQKKTPEDKASLAKQLLERGLEVKDDPASTFVHLREAADLFVAAGDLPGAFGAYDSQAQRFAVSAGDLKVAAYTTALRQVKPGDETERFLATGMELLDGLLAQEQFDPAAKVLPLLQTLTNGLKDAILAGKMQAKLKAAQARVSEWNKVRPAFRRLETAPTDGDASVIAARYYLATGQNWPRALPLLAQCSNEGLAAAAKRDLAQPKETMGKLEAGEAWWSAAQKETGSCKTALTARADDWYRQVLPELTGTSKTLVEGRLNGLATPGTMPSVTPVTTPKNTTGEGSFEKSKTGLIRTIRLDGDAAGLCCSEKATSTTTQVWRRNKAVLST